MSEKIDLDALAAELRREGVLNTRKPTGYNDKMLDVSGDWSVWSNGNVQPTSEDSVDWEVLDIIRRHVAPAPDAPDAGLQLNLVQCPYCGEMADPDTLKFGIGAGDGYCNCPIPAPRIDGVTIPRELAERAVTAFRDSTAWDRHVGFADKRTRAALADADQLSDLLGREGNDD